MGIRCPPGAWASLAVRRRQRLPPHIRLLPVAAASCSARLDFPADAAACGVHLVLAAAVSPAARAAGGWPRLHRPPLLAEAASTYVNFTRLQRRSLLIQQQYAAPRCSCYQQQRLWHQLQHRPYQQQQHVEQQQQPPEQRQQHLKQQQQHPDQQQQHSEQQEQHPPQQQQPPEEQPNRLKNSEGSVCYSFVWLQQRLQQMHLQQLPLLMRRCMCPRCTGISSRDRAASPKACSRGSSCTKVKRNESIDPIISSIYNCRPISSSSSRDEDFPRSRTLRRQYLSSCFNTSWDNFCGSTRVVSSNSHDNARSSSTCISPGLHRLKGRSSAPTWNRSPVYFFSMLNDKRSAVDSESRPAFAAIASRFIQQLSSPAVTGLSSTAAAASTPPSLRASPPVAASPAVAAASPSGKRGTAGTAGHTSSAADEAAATAESSPFMEMILKTMHCSKPKFSLSLAPAVCSQERGLQFFQSLLLLLQQQVFKPREKEDKFLLLISFSWVVLLSAVPLYSAWKRNSRDRRHPYLPFARQLIQSNEDIQRIFGSPLRLENATDTTDSSAHFKRAEIKISGSKASGTVYVSARAANDGKAGEEDFQKHLSYKDTAVLLREQPYLLKFLLVEKLRLLAAALWSVVHGGTYSAAAGSTRDPPADGRSSTNQVQEFETSSSNSSSRWKIESIFAVVRKQNGEGQQAEDKQHKLSCTFNNAATTEATAELGGQKTNSSSQSVSGEADGEGYSGTSSISDSKKSKRKDFPYLIVIKGNPYNNPDALPLLQPEGGDRLQRAHSIGWLLLALLTAGLVRRLFVELHQARHRLLAYSYLRHFVQTHPHLHRLLWRAEMKRRRRFQQEAESSTYPFSVSSSSPSSYPLIISSARSSSSSCSALSADDGARSPLETSCPAAAAAPKNVTIVVDFFTGVMEKQHIKGTASLSYWCLPAFSRHAKTSSSSSWASSPQAVVAGRGNLEAAPAAYECVAELEIEASRASALAPFRAVTSKVSLIEEPDPAAGDPPFPLIKSYLINPHVVASFRPRVFTWGKRGKRSGSAEIASTQLEETTVASGVVKRRRRGN